jgi:hypothetical protein
VQLILLDALMPDGFATACRISELALLPQPVMKSLPSSG